MNDISSEQRNFGELKFSRQHSFFETSIAIRYALGALFLISLFLMLHFREIHIEVLELGTYAPRYVVSQVDFDFFDEEATIILKQEAVRDIGKIYQVDDKQIRLRRGEFENFLIGDEEWRKQLPGATFEQVHFGMELLEKALLSLRLTDPRTLQKLNTEKLSTPAFQIYTPLTASGEVQLPGHIWSNLQSEAFASADLDPITVEFIIQWFKDRSWSLQENMQLQNLLNKKIKSYVQDKYTSIKAGSRLIDLGEKVTMRHVAMLQAMQKALREQRNLWHPLTLIGSLILATILTAICWRYLQINHPLVALSNRRLALLVTVAVLLFIISKGAELLITASKYNLIDFVRYPVFVPFAAILLCSLMSSSIATFASAFLTMILTVALPFERLGFLILNLATALVALLSTHSLKQRNEVFMVCAKAWACSVALIFSFNFYNNIFWNLHVFADILCVGISMLLTAVLVVGLLPLLESGFQAMTDVLIMEYMAPNNELLRQLTVEAPGTYQHSVVVGNLSEAAATAIGANGLFCRAATLYHDVGKMMTPHYFTENQGGNVHQLLTAKESAQTIMAHVPEGVKLAQKAGLPEPFIDIIREHHGTTLVYYFYRKEIDAHGGDASMVNEADFRYKGPKPRSKESAIIMIADSLEAASRSLDDLNEESLMGLATQLIREKSEDGQFDNCLLTCEELAIVKSTLVKTLVAYAHSRIKYPARKVPQLH